jgi:hypothetical protein
MNTMKLEFNKINPEANSGCDISMEVSKEYQRRSHAKEVAMSKKGMLAVVAMGALLCGALVAYAAVSGDARNSSGRMGEVVVTGHAPAMMLDEVVVRPTGVAGGLMPEVVVIGAGPSLLVASPRFERTELN